MHFCAAWITTDSCLSHLPSERSPRVVQSSTSRQTLFQVSIVAASICCMCNYIPYRVLCKIMKLFKKKKFFSLLPSSILFTHTRTHTHFTDHKRSTKTKCFIQGLTIHFSRARPSQPSSCLLSQLLDNIASRIRWMQRPLISTTAENI